MTVLSELRAAGRWRVWERIRQRIVMLLIPPDEGKGSSTCVTVRRSGYFNGLLEVSLTTHRLKFPTYKQVFNTVALEDKPLAPWAIDVVPLSPKLGWYVLRKSTKVVDSRRLNIAKICDVVYVAYKAGCERRRMVRSL